MPNYIGLYYPFIHFKDDAWLKFTALYWDKMGRIVPKAYGSPNDSDTVKKLASELGFIEDFEPQKEAYDLGLKFIDLISQHSKELRKHYDVSQRGMWPDDPITEAMAPPGADPKLAYIFSDKLYNKLREALLDAKLTSVGQGRDERWVGMHPKLASVYMASLAEEIARNRGCHPVTDETINHLAVNGCTLERLAQALLDNVTIVDTKPTKNEIEELLVRFTLQSVIPENMENVPTDNIIKVRKAYPGELANFQKYIHDLVTELEQMDIKDLKYLGPHLELTYSKKIKPTLEDLRARLKSAGIKSTVSAMGISMSSSLLLAKLSVLLALAGPVGPIVAGVGSIALGLTPVILDRNKSVRDAMQSPAAFLFRLEKDLPPSGLFSWIARDSKKFFFGV